MFNTEDKNKYKEYRRNYYRKYYKKKKELGLCFLCLKKATRGTLCEKHYKMHKMRMKKYIEKKISKGICAICNKPLTPQSKRFCAEHLKKRQKRKKY